MIANIYNSIISFLKSIFIENNIMCKWIKNSYLYNFSWEDSDVDQHFLNINDKDTLLCITTGGDNIINYLQSFCRFKQASELFIKNENCINPRVRTTRVFENHR